MAVAPVLVLRVRQREVDEDQAVLGESHLHRLQAEQAARQQTRGRGQRDRERDLRDDQRKAAPPRAARGRAAAKRREEVRARQ